MQKDYNIKEWLITIFNPLLSIETVLKCLLVFAFSAAISFANAQTLCVELTEVGANKNHKYFIDLDSFELRNDLLQGEAFTDRKSGQYLISDGAISYRGKKIFDANEFLYESNVNGIDVLVVRDEYNSFSSPLKLLSALAGHPVQTSKIWILSVQSGKIENKLLLAKEDSSYEWQVKMSSANEGIK